VFGLPFEWTVLILRIVFIFLLYFFVFQVIRVISRELRVVATRGTVAGNPDASAGHGGLQVVDPGDSSLRRGDVYDLDPVSVIGRNRRATIVVDDSFVSSEHAQVTWDEDGWWVSDLGSTNGTFVNGQQVHSPTMFGQNDVVQVGGVSFQLVP
jgi:hypothetical protein